ncbi:MAG: mannose-1-phosphate guanylyltransferase/mannose-6-phosphate isomerase, partial [Sphingomonadaceae bacterium]
MAETVTLQPLLLSGGSGTRLWPLSRADVPKQLQALAHDETMIQATALRAVGTSRGLAFAPPAVVAGEAHQFLIADQLARVGVVPSALLLEPEARNTAPAIALGAHWAARRLGREQILLVMPSDHLIADVAAFHRAIAVAVPAARAGRFVTFGVRPTEPATGYGYIAPAAPDAAIGPVLRFVEKPDRQQAEAYFAEGYLWNAGIFLFRADAFLEALADHAPEVAVPIAESMAACEERDGAVRPDAAAFARAPSISVDYAVMERAADVHVVPVEMGWSDVGSWDALWRIALPDDDGNVRRGAGTLIGCRDSLVRNEGGPFVAALGLDSMIVVSTTDAVLIAPRARAEDIRQVVHAVEAAGLDLARASAEVRRPWGSFRVLGQGEGWQVKRIAVKPGGRLSLQTHAYRAETWVVAAGRALVTLDDETRELAAGQSVEIGIGARHRLENPGPEPLELIEVQRGSYLG